MMMISSQQQQQQQQKQKHKSCIIRCCGKLLLWILIIIWIIGIALFIYIVTTTGEEQDQTNNNDNNNVFEHYLKQQQQQLLSPPFSVVVGGKEVTTSSPHNYYNHLNNNHHQQESSASSMFLRRRHWPTLPLLSLSSLNNYDYLIFHVDYYGDIKIQLKPDLSFGSIQYLHKLVELGCSRCYFHRSISMSNPLVVSAITNNNNNNNNDENNKKKSDNKKEKQKKYDVEFLLGTMSNQNIPLNTQPGHGCPSITLQKKNDNKCSIWNTKNTKYCGCYGPLLETGMVGWVEGTFGGPEFFIFNKRDDSSPPPIFLGTKYTIFGKIVGVDDDDDQTTNNYDILSEIIEEINDGTQVASNTDDTIPTTHSIILKDKIEFTLSLQ